MLYSALDWHSMTSHPELWVLVINTQSLHISSYILKTNNCWVQMLQRLVGCAPADLGNSYCLGRSSNSIDTRKGKWICHTLLLREREFNRSCHNQILFLNNAKDSFYSVFFIVCSCFCSNLWFWRHSLISSAFTTVAHSIYVSYLLLSNKPHWNLVAYLITILGWAQLGDFFANLFDVHLWGRNQPAVQLGLNGPKWLYSLVWQLAGCWLGCLSSPPNSFSSSRLKGTFSPNIRNVPRGAKGKLQGCLRPSLGSGTV